MIRENEGISQNHILTSSSSKHNDLRNIIRSQRFTPLINLIRSTLIAIKSHNTKLRLDLTRIDFDNTDTRSDEFFSEGVGEGAYGGFGRAVDAAAWVGLSACDAADVYYVAGSGIAAREEDGEDGLGHVD